MARAAFARDFMETLRFTPELPEHGSAVGFDYLTPSTGPASNSEHVRSESEVQRQQPRRTSSDQFTFKLDFKSYTKGSGQLLFNSKTIDLAEFQSRPVTTLFATS